VEVRGLIAALFVLLGVAVHMVGCGDNDLIFPGQVPFTPTSEPEPTDTPDPDEEG
jgi:hypothetical protein